MIKIIKNFIIWGFLITISFSFWGCANMPNNHNYNEKIFTGVTLNHLELVKEALEEGADINKISGASLFENNEFGLKANNPLALALTNQNYEIASYLINKGANVNYDTNSGVSFLMYASYIASQDLCELLIKNGAQINDKCVTQSDPDVQINFIAQNGYTALDYALISEQNEYDVLNLVKFLMSQGAKIGSDTLNAAMKGYNDNGTCRYELVQFILKETLKAGYTPKIEPALEAAILGESEKLNTYIQSSEINDQRILFFTAAFGKPETLNALLNIEGINTQIDKDGNSLIGIAAKSGNTTMVKYLISQKQAPVNKTSASGQTPLIAAAMNNHTDTVRLLIKHGSFAYAKEGEAMYNNALFYSAHNGNLEITKMLNKNFPSDNTIIKDIAIEEAIKNNHINIVNFFVQEGMDLNKTESDFTSLEIACRYGKLDIVKYLIENGADPNGSEVLGAPLNEAAQNFQEEIAIYLIHNGADVNAVTPSHNTTAMTSAILTGSYNLVNLLIENGADLQHKDIAWENKTPLEVAQDSGSKNIVHLIRMHTEIA